MTALDEEIIQHCALAGMALTEDGVGPEFYREHPAFALWVAKLVVLLNKREQND